MKGLGVGDSRGKLDLGFKASPTFVGGYADATYAKKTSWGSVGAFATGYAGMTKLGSSWIGGYSAIGGLRVTW